MRIYSSSVLALGIVQLVEALAFFLPQSYFPMYVTSLGASVASVGIFISAFTISSAIFSPAIGRLSDRIGRKKLILFGLVGDALFGILTGLAQSWQLLLVIRFLNGAVSATSILPAEALLIDIVPASRRGEATDFTSTCAMAGRWLGPIFGGSIQWSTESLGYSITNSYRFPYFIDSLLAILGFTLVAWKVSEPENKAIQHPTIKEEKNKMKYTILMKAMLFFSFTYGGAIGLTMPLAALLYYDKFGVEHLTIGTIISITGIIGLWTSWVAGKISDKLGRKPVLALGESIGRMMGFALPLMPNLNMTAFCHFFRKAGFSISKPATDALKADVAPSVHKGEFFGFYQTAYRIGDTTFPIIGTYLYATYLNETFKLANLTIPGYVTPYFLSSSLGLIGLIILLFLTNSKKTYKTCVCK